MKGRGSRKKGFQIRLAVDEREWLERAAEMRALTPSALVRSLIKKEYQALQRAERESASLEPDDILVLKALGERELPADRFELELVFGFRGTWYEVKSWIAVHVRRLKIRGYLQRVGKRYMLTEKGLATIPI